MPTGGASAVPCELGKVDHEPAVGLLVEMAKLDTLEEVALPEKDVHLVR